MPERLVYEVVRPFQGDKAWEAGDLITEYENWPFGRAEQLIDLRLIRPTVVTVDEEPADGQLSIEDMTVPQLQSFAEAHAIDLSGARRRDEILLRIREAENGDQPESDHQG